ncbi:hypothetical protein [Nocardia blacklockiae]|uniref:hypothetical protein n=1 Tax=Nocardia blacklockiae TaxID=480036 RepID=UPI001893EA56|nr:hypothetical protein [Nocardia blacklockiae]MBF6176023.1 hypothetical protein [Nocardia blacklockiae]
MGFVLLDLSKARRSLDEQAIRNRARKLGYDLADILAYRSTDFADVIQHVIATVDAQGAATVIVPDLAHLCGEHQLVRRFCRVVTVNPEDTLE